MRRSVIAISLILLCFTAVYQAVARQVSTTENRLVELREEIAEEERLLQLAENEEQASISRLTDLNRQLSLREELVRTYHDRIEQLKFERDSLQAAIADLGEQLGALQKEYQGRATHAYKHGRQHDAALILSASSINQMLIRIGYLKRFSNKRRDQLEGLRETTSVLSLKRKEMQRKLVESEVMLTSVDREQDNLNGLLGNVRQEINRIQQEKADRSETISQKRTMEQELVDQIRALITAESNRPGGNAEAVLTALTSSFSEAQSLLPWPSTGTVIEPYGDIVHPEFGTITPNPGILIATEASADVKSVFAGTVSTIDIIPDMGRFAIVEHGGFHTVYGNLSLFYVGVGDDVTAGQLLGRSGTAAEPRGESVFFAIFKNGEPENPTSWLRTP